MSTLVVLILTGFVPGFLLVSLCTRTGPSLPWYEKSLYAVGAGYGLIVSGMLVVSLVPGPIELWHIITLYGVLYVILLVAYSLPRLQTGRGLLPAKYLRRMPVSGGSIDRRKLTHFSVIGVLIIVLIIVTVYFRFTGLAYSELQGDEAAVALSAADTIEGYENALFVRLKGPAEVLLPTVIYRATGSLSEWQARAPFAIANTLAVLAIFLLGSRLISPMGGWIAAMLLALDGYLIAFGRILQYQSLVFLMVVLAVLVLYRLTYAPRSLRGMLLLAAIFCATGVLAHYEAVLVVIPGVYLLWQLGRLVGHSTLVRAMVLPVIVGCGLLAVFYLPFVLSPTFTETFWYLFGYRLGGASDVDILQDFFFRTTLYSTTYYVVLLIVLAVLELARVYWTVLPKPIRALAVAALLVVSALLMSYPDWVSGANPRILGGVVALLLSVAWVSPGVTKEARLIWLWYGVTLVAALFLTSKPNSHVYSIFIPWALLAGLAVQHIWQHISYRLPARSARLAAAALSAVLLLAFARYAHLLFVENGVEVLRTWQDNRPKGYWTAYDDPVEIAIFGFPLRNGWNTVAAMYEDGVLDSGFDTNARPAVANWYTRGRGPCARDDPDYYMLSHFVEPTLADERQELRRRLEEKYHLFASVEVQGEPHLEIFRRGDAPAQPLVLDDGQYASETPARNVDDVFRRNGPVGQTEFRNPVDIRLRNGMRLLGYEVGGHAVSPGDDLAVTLFWEAEWPIPDNYGVSVQVIDLNDLRKAGQRDGEPGCNQYPTAKWIPGDHISDQYRVPIAHDALPGDYTLLITVYSEQGSVEIVDDGGNPIGTSIPLSQIRVAE